MKNVTEVIVPEGAQTVYFKGIGNGDPQSGLMYTIKDNGCTRSVMLCRNCKYIERLYISSTVDHINKDALRLFYNLECIEVHTDNAVYRSEDGILYSKDMTTIIKVPENIKCSVLELKPTIRKIESLALFECSRIKELHVPRTVTGDLKQSVTLLRELEAVYVEEGSSTYSSFDGILMNKNQTEVLACPIKKSGSIVLPNTVTAIRAFAFHMCNNITRITLNEGIRTIGNYAFESASLITEITLPSTLEALESSSFSNMKNLKKVVFKSIVKTDDIRSEFRSSENIEQVELPEGGESMLYAFLFHKNIKTITIGNRRFRSRVPFELNLFIDKQAPRPTELIKPLLALLQDHRYVSAGDKKLTAIAAAHDHLYDKNENAKKYIRNHSAQVICDLCITDNAELLKGILEMPGLRLSGKDNAKIVSAAIENTQNGGGTEVQIMISQYMNDLQSGIFSELDI